MGDLNKIYKLYNIEYTDNYIGVNANEVCKINGELGVFKLPLRHESKDHIVEGICYRLACK